MARSAGALLVLVAPVFSSPLLNNPVTGALQFGGSGLNYFDPLNGYVPWTIADRPAAPANSAAYQDSYTVTIPAASVPAWAFGYQDPLATEIDIEFLDGYTFTVSQFPVIPGPAGPWIIQLSWGFDAITGVQYGGSTFSPGVLIDSFNARNVTLTFAGTDDTDLPSPGGVGGDRGGFSATFVLSDVPEPATLGLVFGGLAGLGLMSGKRRG